MLEPGKVHYDEKGNPRCHICGKSYKKVLSHVWQKHGMSAEEYKKKFGLDLNKGLICEETRKTLQQHIKNNYNKVVTENLINKGKNTRFEKGSKGRTADQVSLQTLNRLKGSFKDYPGGRKIINEEDI